jgi:hypothetical protein
VIGAGLLAAQEHARASRSGDTPSAVPGIGAVTAQERAE